jgi:hypothetical protein
MNLGTRAPLSVLVTRNPRTLAGLGPEQDLCNMNLVRVLANIVTR